MRFYVTAHMDTIVHNMSVDIGFGDVVSPCPMTIDFPLLLPDIPSVNLQAYSLETVVAEKFHAMIDRDETNSRMKDFFDCYMLFTQRNISDETLFEAIKATFDNRALAYKPNLKLFSDGFATDKERIIRWKAFLKKIQWKEDMAKGVRVRQGDVFCVKLDEKTKGYFQFLFRDSSQLGGNVIRVFYKHYPNDYDPTIDEIISDDVAFFTHTFVQGGIYFDVFTKIGNVKVLNENKLPGVIFCYQSTPYEFDNNYPKEMWSKKMWYVYQANETLVLYETLPKNWRNKVELGWVMNFESVVWRMKFGFYLSGALDSIQKRIPRPDADIYVQIPDKNGKPKTMINFHGEKAVRQIYFKRTGVVRVSEDRPCVGLRLLRRRKFSSSFWEYDNFIEKDEFERTWNEA